MPEETLAHPIMDSWISLIADTSGDELSEGGQSLKELERIEALEAALAKCDGIEVPTFHHFSDGVYLRECRPVKDTILIGHEHRHECLNIMLAGRVLTITNGTVTEFVAPCIVKSGAHTRKASIVVQDMIWLTSHPNPDNETDIAKLDERLFKKSQTFLEYESSKNAERKS